MKQTDWKIIYSSYRGVAKRAIKLLSREVGRYVIREQGVYRIHVLPCEQEGVEVSKNAFFCRFLSFYDSLLKNCAKSPSRQPLRPNRTFCAKIKTLPDTHNAP